MENLKEVVQQYLPMIGNYAITIICYILFFIIRYSTKRSSETLQSLVKEKVSYVDRENVGVKNSVDRQIKYILSENARLEKEIARLEEQLIRTQKAVAALIEEEE